MHRADCLAYVRAAILYDSADRSRCTLTQEARLIVIDEPTASLDFGNQVKVLRQVKRLAARGLGVVLSRTIPIMH